MRGYRYYEPKTTRWRSETLDFRPSYRKVLLSVTGNAIASLWGPTRSLSTALCVTTDGGLAIRYFSVVVYRLPHKKHAKCTLLCRLWWQRHTPLNPPSFDCQTCYAKTWPSCMPEGYEDVKTIKELKACKKELDNLTQKQTGTVLGTEHDKSEG
jgi:hypothetical protein